MKKIFKIISKALLSVLILIALAVIVFSVFVFRQLILPKITAKNTVHIIAENICNAEEPLLNDRRHRIHRKNVSFTEFKEFQKNLIFCQTPITDIKYTDISMLSSENHIVADVLISNDLQKNRLGIVLTSRHAQPYTWSIGGIYPNLKKNSNIWSLYSQELQQHIRQSPIKK